MTQHEPPPKHQHKCWDCSSEYSCQSPECRRLLWYRVCYRCDTKAQNYFDKALQAVYVKLDPLETLLQKERKKEFGPRPKQPTYTGKR